MNEGQSTIILKAVTGLQAVIGCLIGSTNQERKAMLYEIEWPRDGVLSREGKVWLATEQNAKKYVAANLRKALELLGETL